jgi:regulator of sirC expression with transglutaminase-like and TPR domain
MGTRAQLPHLIRLLEDDSDVVRRQILQELLSFGPDLEEELRHQKIVLSRTQQEILDDLFAESSREWLEGRWGAWMEVRDDKLQLEMALGMLAQYLHGIQRPVALERALDGLAEEYRAAHPANDVRALAQFLFTTKGIAGADQSDFYNPLHSSLVHAIERRRGIPITLCALYILVGHRLGLDIEGCNFPGHFLALAFTKHQKHIVDCFNGGLFLSESDFAALSPSVSIELKELFQLECDATTIVLRVLRNLVNAYQRQNRQASVEFIGKLMGRIETAESGDEEGER